MFKKQSGFTLIELLIVLFIGATITTYLIQRVADWTNERTARTQGAELAEIMYMIDNRLAIDSLEARFWGKGLLNTPLTLGELRDIDIRDTFFSENLTSLEPLLFNNINDFFTTQLYSATSGCARPSGLGERQDDDSLESESDWMPIHDSNNDPENSFRTNYTLTRCNFWPNRIPLTNKIDEENDKNMVTINAIQYGGYDIIDTIDVDIDIDEAKNDPDNMARLFLAIEEAKLRDSNNVTGKHVYSFVDPTETRNSNEYFLSPANCLTNDNCIIRLSLETMAHDGSEYLQVSGRNNMRGNISFEQDPEDRTNNSTINSCYLWKYQATSNTWEQVNENEDPESDIEEVECGLRLDQEDGEYVVNLTANSISATRSIQMRGECDYSEFLLGGSLDQDEFNNKFSDFGVSSGAFQCGAFTTEDGEKLIITTDEIYAQNIYSETINTNTANIVGQLNLEGAPINYLNADFIIDSENNSNDDETDPILRISQNPVDEYGAIDYLTTINTILNVKNNVVFEGEDFYIESNIRGQAFNDRYTDITSNETGDNSTIENFISINGTRVLLANQSGTARRGIDTFTEDGELVTKEYVDVMAGITIREIKRGVESGDIITVPSCAGANPQPRIFVTPLTTFGTPDTSIYSATLISATGDETPVAGDIWEITLVTDDSIDFELKGNAIVYCEPA